MIVDFEGEPQRSLDERRRKFSPLRDLAGMLRSFDYMAWAALGRRQAMVGSVPEVERDRAMFWRDRAAQEFLDAYDRAVNGVATMPDDQGTAEVLRAFFTLQKAIYEVGYELANRPSWLPIPVRGILNLLGRYRSFP
jgi:maltose alpha-D-glucosyltransferase/alpha-amylase